MDEIQELIAEVERLDEAATPGPWKPYNFCVLTETDASGTVRKICDLTHGYYVPDEQAQDNRNLIASFRTAAPRLAKEVSRLAAENAELRKLLDSGREAGRYTSLLTGERGVNWQIDLPEGATSWRAALEAKR